MSGSEAVYVVSGGAGGLGRAVVLNLLGRGARVAVPYRSEGSFDALRRAAPQGGEALWGAASDVADLDSSRRFMDEAAQRFGRLDGLAALAGAYAGSGPLEASPATEWDDMMHANLATAHAACRAILPHLLGRGGSVVTVSSRLVASGGARSVAYAVSKAGVEALTRGLAAENADRRVRFNCIAPGIIDTPSNRRAMAGADTSRWTPPEQIAGVVAFLLSPESAPVSGALIPVDGPRP